MLVRSNLYMIIKSTLDSCCIMTQKSIMSRPFRIQYAGAWCHVMNRGRRGEEVFEGKKDYNTFIDLLKELVEEYHVNIAAYCLMSNHNGSITSLLTKIHD